MLESVRELVPVVGVQTACAVLSVPRSTYYHDLQPSSPSPAPAPRPPSHRALPADEQLTVRDLLNSERFVDRAPRTVYATLLDEGVYHCSWRTMYRILAQHDAVRERRTQRRRPQYAAPELLATGPRQVWSWDITKLRGPHPGCWYSLYVVLDIFSRKIVGWRIETREDAAIAEAMVAEAVFHERIAPHQLTLHADRGAAMTSKTLSTLLLDLGVARSHSRPTISDDNPYSEAQFKTMKYGPRYPERFAGITEARSWMRAFTAWYNDEHRHSGLSLLPPSVVHDGRAAAVQVQRQAVLDAGYLRHPERFPRGRPQVQSLPEVVGINLPRSTAATAATVAAGPEAAAVSRVSAAQRPLDTGEAVGQPFDG